MVSPGQILRLLERRLSSFTRSGVSLLFLRWRGLFPCKLSLGVQRSQGTVGSHECGSRDYELCIPCIVEPSSLGAPVVVTGRNKCRKSIPTCSGKVRPRQNPSLIGGKDRMQEGHGMGVVYRCLETVKLSHFCLSRSSLATSRTWGLRYRLSSDTVTHLSLGKSSWMTLACEACLTLKARSYAS